MVVPIHSYPVVNTADFPTAVDFGTCSITEKMTKVVPLKCHAPIQFEFELKIAKPHAFFEVYPTQGVVPANSQVDITFNFHPLKLHSASMEVEVNISQFGFEPFTCILTGAGVPEITSSEPVTLELPRTLKLETNVKPTFQKSKTVKAKRPVPPEPRPDVMVEGILMPAVLDTVHHAAGVLTSQPGKLKIHDLKKALKEKGESAVSGRQMLEAAFVAELGQMVEQERHKEIRPALANCKVQTWGDTLKTIEELQQIEDEREARLTTAVNQQREEGRQRTKTVVTSGRPKHDAKAVPTFYQPSWELEDEPEGDKGPAMQQVQTQMVELTSNMLTQTRLSTRIGELRKHVASFSTQEDLLAAIKATTHAKVDDGPDGRMDFSGVPADPALPMFPEEELAAPDPVDTIDICSFDDTCTVPLEVPKFFELMGYSDIPIPATPAYVTVETSRLLLSGAEEEELERGSRPIVVKPACTTLATAPPGAKFAHEPTVLPPPKQIPLHTVPVHCKEPLPFNPVEMVKPPLRIRACSQLLRYPETACDRLLGPVAPALGVTSLDEACGSNAVLSLTNLTTMQSVVDSTRRQRERSWFDNSIPGLLTGPPAPASTEGVDPSWAAPVSVDPVEVPHPFQDSVLALAKQTKETRDAWSERLVARIRGVNELITQPVLKLTYS